jgi:DNA-binding NtrC family response regulator
MNILFIEDEKELAATGVAQLELKEYTVFPAYSIAEAQTVLDDPKRPVHIIIADHRLPDGQGIKFVLEMKKLYPQCKCAVVSGCLTPANIEELEKNDVPYYHKPLLYAQVVDDLRRIHAKQAKDPQLEGIEKIELADVKEVDPEDHGFHFWPFK